MSLFYKSILLLILMLFIGYTKAEEQPDINFTNVQHERLDLCQADTILHDTLLESEKVPEDSVTKDTPIRTVINSSLLIVLFLILIVVITIILLLRKTFRIGKD